MRRTCARVRERFGGTRMPKIVKAQSHLNGRRNKKMAGWEKGVQGAGAEQKERKKARSGEADEQGFYGRRKWKNLPANLAKRAQTLTTTGMGERPPVRARKIKASWQLLNHPPRYYSLSLFLSLPLSLSRLRSPGRESARGTR